MKKELAKISKLLLWICAGIEVLDSMIITPKELKKRAMKGNLFKSTHNFESLYYYLIRRGFIRYIDKNSEKFIKITKKGRLAVLLAKSKMKLPKIWDGKWRVIIFDIPEKNRLMRNQLRKLLRDYGYKKLQASVFISPYPLNRDAISYLKETGLIHYIRFLKVEEIDDDTDLRKMFNL